MRTVLGVALGAALGALAGLVVATLVNANCDSFLEAASGCRRVDLGALTTIGAVVGVIVGGLAGILLDVRASVRASRRRLREEEDRLRAEMARKP